MNCKLTDKHLRVLCKLIGECWHPKERLTYWYVDMMGGCVCHACNQEVGFSPSRRTFLSGNDMVAVKEAIEKSGEWQQFCSYADTIFMQEKMKGVNGHYISIYEFDGWLLEPERFCWLAAEWKMGEGLK